MDPAALAAGQPAPLVFGAVPGPLPDTYMVPIGELFALCDQDKYREWVRGESDRRRRATLTDPEAQPADQI